MPSSVALLRGINVSGRNMIAMPALVECFRDAGYREVASYIQSGNVVFTADPASGAELESSIEGMLETRFGMQLLVVVRSRDELAVTIAAAPADHGSENLRSDVFFFKDPRAVEATYSALPELREGVDTVALGPGAIYFSRVAALATKTRITAVMSKPAFKQMTARNWRTTTRLLALLDE